jgi:hypothetical protein
MLIRQQRLSRPCRALSLLVDPFDATTTDPERRVLVVVVVAEVDSAVVVEAEVALVVEVVAEVVAGVDLVVTEVAVEVVAEVASAVEDEVLQGVVVPELAVSSQVPDRRLPSTKRLCNFSRTPAPMSTLSCLLTTQHPSSSLTHSRTKRDCLVFPIYHVSIHIY